MSSPKDQFSQSASERAGGAVGASVSTSGSNQGAQYAQHSPSLGTITKYPASGISASSRATSLVAKAEKIDTIDPETGEITTFERSRSGAFWSVKSAMVFDAVFAIIFDAKKGCFAMVFFHLILMAITSTVHSYGQ